MAVAGRSALSELAAPAADLGSGWSLVSAGVDALRLKRGGSKQKLRRIANRLAKGETRDLPPVELLPGSATPGAAGALRRRLGRFTSTRTASGKQYKEIINVLTEEYGHYLDKQLNKLIQQATKVLFSQNNFGR